ncbi:hypothetical protein [Myroides pelagicus]|uniref:Uncharacterized protein n=1 Tax=Myroides pelagicus TaxID=270914 RepID=A0A7K1GJZ4_9FLAO|nr:hypothetical protein [Myroides pelagicus]MEC4114073.1 hypothetical protein [Myroides pelagicus]MTH29202.1 hypothetical protein [Myroides pelagicus]
MSAVYVHFSYPEGIPWEEYLKETARILHVSPQVSKKQKDHLSRIGGLFVYKINRD